MPITNKHLHCTMPNDIITRAEYTESCQVSELETTTTDGERYNAPRVYKINSTTREKKNTKKTRSL